MTRDQWIQQARDLLQDNPKAEALLAVSFDAPKIPAVIVPEVVEAEVVEGEVIESPGQKVARVKPVTVKVPQRRQSGARSGFARRFGAVLKEVVESSEDAGEAELSGFDRLDVRTGQAAERLLDKAMDSARSLPEKMPTLGDRGAAFRGRRLGRVKKP